MEKQSFSHYGGQEAEKDRKGGLRCIFPGQAPGGLILQLSPAVGDGFSFPHLPIRSSHWEYIHW